MNQNLYSYSESIVFSLCKEIEFIKIRSKNINFKCILVGSNMNHDNNDLIFKIKKPRWKRWLLFQFHYNVFPENFSVRRMYHNALIDIWKNNEIQNGHRY